MGCCCSSPHQARVYRDPGDLDEEVLPLRFFGTNRAGSNLVPDHIDGMPSSAMQKRLAQNSDLLLYEAEIDHGFAFRCARPIFLCLFLPAYLAVFLAVVATQGLSQTCIYCSCDQMCCWLRKEYSTRHYFRIYPNRIVTNNPRIRWPFGYCGCGSWNGDYIQAHPFDRGAFGFQRAYFEGRAITREDMDKCIEYFHDNIYEVNDPEGRKRDVCCEPFCFPNLKCTRCYGCNHCEREIPYADEDVTDETREVWAKYKEENPKQVEHFKKSAAVYSATCCRSCGCRRCFGRKGCCFCTEGCHHCDRKAGDPAPPLDEHHFDDDYDASSVLFTVLGPPPPNVVIKRWRYDVEKGENVLVTFPAEEVEFEDGAAKPKKRAVSEKKEDVKPEEAVVAEEEANADTPAENATSGSEGAATKED